MRTETRSAHDQLDREISAIGWSSAPAYIRFLQVQHSARLPIEQWIARECPPDLQAPKQAHLIEQDLEDLGESTLPIVGAFNGADDAGKIGAVWALAGSSLGNAMIRRSVLKTKGGADLPNRFLSDPLMGQFWKSMLPALNADVDLAQAQSARDGAIAVFSHFLRTVETHQARKAA